MGRGSCFSDRDAVTRQQAANSQPNAPADTSCFSRSTRPALAESLLEARTEQRQLTRRRNLHLGQKQVGPF
jgi:hypothetical protein